MASNLPKSLYKCPKTAITADKVLLASKHEYSHESVPGKHEARQIVGTMKQTAKTNPVNSALSPESLQAVPTENAILFAQEQYCWIFKPNISVSQ